jgi:futalosine hydrolase
MKLLIAAATELEIASLKISMQRTRHVDFLITGVGMTATTYHLAKILSVKKYDLAINAGICGSFRKDIEVGKVVHVISDCFGDLGAEDGSNFLSAFEVGLQKKNQFPFRGGKLSPLQKKYSALYQLRKVNSITVNKAHGEWASINKVVKKFNPDIETMEGAAFFYVCMMERIPCIQLRSISNFVGRRDKRKWKIGLAVAALQTKLEELIMEIVQNS